MINQEQKKKDLKLGEDGECEVFRLLKLRHGDNVKKYRKKYSTFDYYVVDENNKIIKEYELKSRRCGLRTYPTLAFGLNKILYADKKHQENIETTFLWKLNEGVFEWNYDGTQSYELGSICNKARNDRPHDAVFVKTNDIKPFDNVGYLVWV